MRLAGRVDLVFRLEGVLYAQSATKWVTFIRRFLCLFVSTFGSINLASGLGKAAAVPWEPPGAAAAVRHNPIYQHLETP